MFLRAAGIDHWRVGGGAVDGPVPRPSIPRASRPLVPLGICCRVIVFTGTQLATLHIYLALL